MADTLPDRGRAELGCVVGDRRVGQRDGPELHEPAAASEADACRVVTVELFMATATMPPDPARPRRHRRVRGADPPLQSLMVTVTVDGNAMGLSKSVASGAFHTYRS